MQGLCRGPRPPFNCCCIFAIVCDAVGCGISLFVLILLAATESDSVITYVFFSAILLLVIVVFVVTYRKWRAQPATVTDSVKGSVIKRHDGYDPNNQYQPPSAAVLSSDLTPTTTPGTPDPHLTSGQ